MKFSEFRKAIRRLGLTQFTNDKNLADKVSERGVKAVALLMDRVHNIKVEKERV